MMLGASMPCRIYDPTEDQEDLIFWRKWQAPSFIVMEPSKLRRFDPAKAWERNDPAASSEWLKKFEEDYILRLESRIEAAAGHMAVESATNPGPQQVPEVEPTQTRGSEGCSSSAVDCRTFSSQQ
jgi:hypothetical protein